MNFTQHQQVSYTLKLAPAASNLWQWMVEHRNDDAYELTEFNNWVER